MFFLYIFLFLTNSCYILARFAKERCQTQICYYLFHSPIYSTFYCQQSYRLCLLRTWSYTMRNHMQHFALTKEGAFPPPPWLYQIFFYELKFLLKTTRKKNCWLRLNQEKFLLSYKRLLIELRPNWCIKYGLNHWKPCFCPPLINKIRINSLKFIYL